MPTSPLPPRYRPARPTTTPTSASPPPPPPSALRIARTREEKGYTVESLCLSDCQTTAFAAVDEAYCSEGVEADAVLSITKPPGFEGVAGSGSACATEARGRPLWRAP